MKIQQLGIQNSSPPCVPLLAELYKKGQTNIKVIIRDRKPGIYKTQHYLYEKITRNTMQSKHYMIGEETGFYIVEPDESVIFISGPPILGEYLYSYTVCHSTSL